MTLERLVERHVQCDVTGLVREMVASGNAVGHDLMHGDYDAIEVWAVSTWLAARLESRGQRVVECWYQWYWARGDASGPVGLDGILAEIADQS